MNNLTRLFPALFVVAVLVAGISSCRSERDADFHFEAMVMEGEFNGPIGNGGEFNYYIHLSDKGFDSTGNALQDATYYRFDIFSSAPQNYDDISVPAGRYILGSRGSTACGTFTSDYSLYFTNGPEINSGTQLVFSQGYIDISYENGTYTVDAELTDIAGMTHKVTYKGSASLKNNASMAPELEIKPLDQDLYIFSDDITATNYGTVNNNGIYNIVFSMTDMPYDSQGNVITPGNVLNMDCYASLTSDGRIAPGNYEILQYWGTQDYTLSPGGIVNDRFVGTLAIHYNNNGSASLGLLSSGTLNISHVKDKEGGNAYRLEFCFITEDGYQVSGSYEGPVKLSGKDQATTKMEQKSGKRPVSTPFANNVFSVR